jgi:hypothetical protein
MNRMVLTSRVGSDGVLQVTLPLGTTEANREVQVTVEPVGPPPMAQEEWRRLVLETAGQWQGDFERPEPGELEEREPLG